MCGCLRLPGLHSAAELDSSGEISHLGVTDVQVAIGLGWEPRNHLAACHFQVLSQLLCTVPYSQHGPVAECDCRLDLCTAIRHQNSAEQALNVPWRSNPAVAKGSTKINVTRCSQVPPVHASGTSKGRTWLFSKGLGKKA